MRGPAFWGYPRAVPKSRGRLMRAADLNPQRVSGEILQIRRLRGSQTVTTKGRNKGNTKNDPILWTTDHTTIVYSGCEYSLRRFFRGSILSRFCGGGVNHAGVS